MKNSFYFVIFNILSLVFGAETLAFVNSKLILLTFISILFWMLTVIYIAHIMYKEEEFIELKWKAIK